MRAENDVGEADPLVAQDGVLDRGEEEVAVPVRAEEREAGDAPGHHVVDPAGRLRSETTCHPVHRTAGRRGRKGARELRHGFVTLSARGLTP